MPPTQPERTDRSRRAILDAATPVFARQGYAAASLNRIIESSGLTKGGFYFHFPSKQALALAVVADHQERWIARVRNEISTHERAVDRLFAAPRTIARLASGGEGPADMRKLIDELAQDPDLRDEVCASLRIWLATVTEHFQAAQDEGSVRSDIHAAVLAEVAVGGFSGMQAMTEQFDDGELIRRVESLIRVVQLAVLTDVDAVEDVPRRRGRGKQRG